jgi:hypothetical protein
VPIPLIAGDLVGPEVNNPADVRVLRQVAGEVAGTREHDGPEKVPQLTTGSGGQ